MSPTNNNDHRCEGCTYHWMHSSGLEMCDKDWDCSKEVTSNDSAEYEFYSEEKK